MKITKVKPLYFLNIVLSIVLLTSLMVNATTNRNGTAAVGEYDPWKDINDDGIIDMQDIVAEILAFGTKGDITKNVNVTNFPSAKSQYELQHFSINFTNSGYTGFNIYCGGYSRVGVLMRPKNAIVANYSITFYLYGIGWWAPSWQASSFERFTTYVFNSTIHVLSGIPSWSSPEPFLTETKAPYCCPAFWLGSSDAPPEWWILIDFYVYLRND